MTADHVSALMQFQNLFFLQETRFANIVGGYKKWPRQSRFYKEEAIVIALTPPSSKSKTLGAGSRRALSRTMTSPRPGWCSISFKCRSNSAVSSATVVLLVAALAIRSPD